MAPSTRKTTRVEKTTPAPTRPKQNLSQKQAKRQNRLLAELHTEGTGLKGDFPERRPAIYYRGAWYEEQGSEQHPPAPIRNKRACPDAAGPASGRLRKAPKRARYADETREASVASNPSPDEVFLRDTKRQLRASRAAKGSIRRHDIEKMLPHLASMNVPAGGRIRRQVESHGQPPIEETDLFILDPREARRLLSSNNAVTIPVFVPDGAPPLFDPALDDRRPIEQALDHFHNPSEADETIDGSRRVGTGRDIREIKISDLRARLLPHPSAPRTYPYNFPDIPNPLLAAGVPAFAQDARNGVLKHAVRNLLGALASPRAVCPERCPHARHAALRCGRHRLSAPELVHLQSGWLHWQSTMMLAEAGALTHAHADKWGFGTWVACYEGEMAFAWLSRPSEQLRARWQATGSGERVGPGENGNGGDGDDDDDEEEESRWVFVVLRPGNALYLPSGTVHTVFRRPEGGPTLALAGHIVRSPDVAAWLRALRVEIVEEIRNPDIAIPYGDIVSCLVAGMKEIFDRDDMSDRELERYGGEEKLADARALLDEIDKLVDDL